MDSIVLNMFCISFYQPLQASIQNITICRVKITLQMQSVCERRIVPKKQIISDNTLMNGKIFSKAIRCTVLTQLYITVFKILFSWKNFSFMQAFLKFSSFWLCICPTHIKFSVFVYILTAKTLYLLKSLSWQRYLIKSHAFII